MSEAKLNRAMRIDTSLARTLKRLPRLPRAEANLALRNLMRGAMVTLGTGQQMARFLRSKGVAVTTLSKQRMRDGRRGAELDGLTGPQRDALLKNTPLCFYVLREAEFNGRRSAQAPS